MECSSIGHLPRRNELDPTGGAIFLAYQEWMQFEGTTTHDSNQYFLAKGDGYLVCVVVYDVVAYPTV